MERVLQWIRQNPTWFALAFGLACVVWVSVILGVSMRKAGLSLKPLFFFLGCLAIVGGPQATVHFLDTWYARKPISSARTLPIPTTTPTAAPWKQVFGADADPSLQTDARISLAAALPGAEEARLSFDARGESALAARFPSPSAAQDGYRTYLRFFGLVSDEASPPPEVSAQRYRGQGEWNLVLVAGRELYAWTGPSAERVGQRREQALGSPASLPTVPNPPAHPILDRLRANRPAMALFVVLNLIAAVLWFFKGSAWATREAPSLTARPISPSELRTQLLTLNQADYPVTITEAPDGTGLVATWRTADAQWLDLMRLNRVRLVYRLNLSFDPESRTVRVTEYRTLFEGSADPSGLKVKWHFSTGLTFFEKTHSTVLGIQLDDRGRPTGGLSKTFRFDSAALKQPLARMVTSGGWTWQPVVVLTPPSLHWLTE